MSAQKGMANSDIRNRIRSGYEGNNIPSDYQIPSVGLRDVDHAMFSLFDRDNVIYIQGRDEDTRDLKRKKVPVVFATGERFALRERKIPIRDKSGALMLPIISIRRTGINQAREQMGSAIGQDTGDLVIKKRISPEDPLYQNLINKRGLKNQENVAAVSNYLNQVLETGSEPGTVASRRDKGTSFGDKTLDNKLGAKNFYEILTIPMPIRYTASYEITFWTSFQAQMNEMIEKVMTNYDGQGRTYKLQTDKGYYFVAYFEDEIEPDDNFEDYTDEQRVHRYTMRVTVPAYLVGNTNAGDMIPIRRFISAPQVSFELIDGNFGLEKNIEAPLATKDAKDKFVLDDIEKLDQRGNPVKRTPNPDFIQEKIIRDPFSGKDEKTFLKIKSRNARVGETVISSRRLGKFEIP